MQLGLVKERHAARTHTQRKGHRVALPGDFRFPGARTVARHQKLAVSAPPIYLPGDRATRDLESNEDWSLPASEDSLL